MRRAGAVVWRITRQVARDRRLAALALGMPVIVMSILAAVVRAGAPPPRVALVAEGAIDLFSGPIVERLEAADMRVSRPDARAAEARLRAGAIDGVIVFPRDFLDQRAAGRAGRVEVRVEGVDPAASRAVIDGLRKAMAGLVSDMPALVPVECPDACAEAAAAPPPSIDVVALAGERELQDFYLPAVAPLVVFFFGYVLTAMAFLRERTGGTLERIFATPLAPWELTLGYFGGFLSLAAVQAAVVLGFLRFALGVPNAGSWSAIAALLLVTAVAAEGIGVFLSTLARSEFQVVQFVPLILLPQVFLCGLFWPIEHLPAALRPLSHALPLTYATRAVRDLMLRGDTARALPSMAAVAAFAAGAALLASLAMRRRAY